MHRNSPARTYACGFDSVGVKCEIQPNPAAGHRVSPQRLRLIVIAIVFPLPLFEPGTGYRKDAYGAVAFANEIVNIRAEAVKFLVTDHSLPYRRVGSENSIKKHERTNQSLPSVEPVMNRCNGPKFFGRVFAHGRNSSRMISLRRLHGPLVRFRPPT